MLRIERRVTAGAAVVALAAGLGSAAWTAPARAGTPDTAATTTTATTATPATTVTLDPAHPAGTLPADFVGLSFEMRELGVGSFDARAGNLVALFRTLNRAGNVRISGNTLDRDTLWVPAGQSAPDPLPDWVQDVVTPADLTRLDRFLGATGWHTEVGINVGHYDAALAADQARAMTAILGHRLVGAECGNEPNAWVGKGFRPAGYGYPQYKLDWEACAATLGSHPLAGPDTSSPKSTGPWFTSFAQDEHARLSMLTAHNYSVGSSATVADLLSPQTDASELSSVSAQLAAARAVGVPVRLDETNSAAGGGILGVSDTYAAALWAMDYSLLMAQDGFAGLDFHGGLGVCNAPLYNGKFQIYTPICAANDADAAAKVYTAAPEYYGLYLASRMGSGTFLPVTVSSDHNVTAYAVRGRDGKTRIAVIEKDDTAGAPVRVDLALGGGRGTRHAEAIHLTGASLAGKDGIAVQGASVDRAGHLRPHAPDRLTARDGSLSLDVAAGSAVLITLDSGCR